MTDPDTPASTSKAVPLWVKVQGAAVALLVLVVLAMSSGLLNIGLLSVGSAAHGGPPGGHGAPMGPH